MSEPTESSNKGFFEYVFNFDDTNTNQITNLYQYTFIAIPFVILSLKLLNYFSSQVDETKGSLEVFFEIFISINWILLSIWFINKIIRYIPTKSKINYPMFDETNFILPLLLMLFTMDTKFGNKINLLIERAIDLYDGKTNLKNSNNNINQSNHQDIRTTQPISPPESTNSRMSSPPSSINTSYQTPINKNNYSENQNTKPLQNPPNNFNNDFAGPNINNLLAANEPIAANESFGGIFGGSVF
jgi:hypothetical protein